jgi:hypothetical protein
MTDEVVSKAINVLLPHLAMYQSQTVYNVNIKQVHDQFLLLTNEGSSNSKLYSNPLCMGVFRDPF